jgi:hypothetical protein
MRPAKELAGRVQAVSPTTKALLMSGYQTSDIAPSGRAFMAKPFDLGTLEKRVRETLAQDVEFWLSLLGLLLIGSGHPRDGPPRLRPLAMNTTAVASPGRA